MRTVGRVHDRAAEHDPDLVQQILEGGDDAEVPATAAQAPEELLVLVGAGRHELSGGRDDVGRDEVVAGEAVLPHQPADPAAEGEAGDARCRDLSPGRGKPERARLVVEGAPVDAAFSACRHPRGIDANAAHRRQVEHDPAVAGGVAGHTVPAPANGQKHAVLAREVDPGDHVGHAGATRDQRRPLVEHRVPRPARLLVAFVAGREHVATKALDPCRGLCLNHRNSLGRRWRKGDHRALRVKVRR